MFTLSYSTQKLWVLNIIFLSIIFFLSTQSFLSKILMISGLNSFDMWTFLIIIWTTVSSCTHPTDSIRVLLHVFGCKKYAFRFKQRWRLSEFWKHQRKVIFFAFKINLKAAFTLIQNFTSIFHLNLLFVSYTQSKFETFCNFYHFTKYQI